MQSDTSSGLSVRTVANGSFRSCATNRAGTMYSPTSTVSALVPRRFPPVDSPRCFSWMPMTGSATPKHTAGRAAGPGLDCGAGCGGSRLALGPEHAVTVPAPADSAIPIPNRLSSHPGLGAGAGRELLG